MKLSDGLYEWAVDDIDGGQRVVRAMHNDVGGIVVEVYRPRSGFTTHGCAILSRSDARALGEALLALTGASS